MLLHLHVHLNKLTHSLGNTKKNFKIGNMNYRINVKLISSNKIYSRCRFHNILVVSTC